MLQIILCLKGKSTAVLLFCERQSPEKVQTPLSGHSPEFMSENSLLTVPARCGVLMWRNDDHLHGDGGAEQVDHLLVRQRGH